MRSRLLLVVPAVAILVFVAASAHAGGTVSTCNEASLLAALTGGGTVTFDCSGTIVLTNTITVGANTTIDGDGHEATISGNNAVQVFYVGSTVTLNLKGLTIADGNAIPAGAPGGGAVETWGGSVTIDDSVLLNNRAFSGGAVYVQNGGTVAVSRSTFSNNSAYDQGYYGGAVFAKDSTLTVIDSTFSDNAAIEGGAIWSDCDVLDVSRCTFSNNMSGSSGGAIATLGTARVSNSTFYSNVSYDEYGGGIANRGVLTVTNCTFFYNEGIHGGAIFNLNNQYHDGQVTLQNSIVANSFLGVNCYGPIIDGGGNLSYPDTSCPGINEDPMLGLLQDNGGPTRTMAPVAGSAAIDAAEDAVCAAEPINNLDQRGVVRPVGEHCDIGAVEHDGVGLPRFWPIDVKPGSDPNSINCRATNGIITVAILTTDTWDATTIDHASVTFEGAVETHVDRKTAEPVRHEEDVDGDGDLDLVLHFRLGDTELTCDSTEAVLSGRTFDGNSIAGADYVRMVPSTK